MLTVANDLLLSNYRKLIEAALALDVPVITVRDCISSKPINGFFIFRHDVEWRCSNALRMAEIEREYGIHATYYFHGPHRKSVFRPREIHEFAAMGHEVGYHYETLDQCNGDFDAARRLFIRRLV